MLQHHNYYEALPILEAYLETLTVVYFRTCSYKTQVPFLFRVLYVLSWSGRGVANHPPFSRHFFLVHLYLYIPYFVTSMQKDSKFCNTITTNILLTNSISHLLRKNDGSVTAYLWYKHAPAIHVQLQQWDSDSLEWYILLCYHYTQSCNTDLLYSITQHCTCHHELAALSLHVCLLIGFSYRLQALYT